MAELAGRVLADPPRVHPQQGAHNDVWSTELACYQFIERTVSAGDHTLETGLGVSTVIFALLGCWHTVVAPAQSEHDILVDHCRSRSIDLSRVTLVVDYSDRALPDLQGPLDLAFIDGSHGFPFPAIDWFYSCERLREGGVVVLDDVFTPGVAPVADFLANDPRWETMAGSSKWAAFRRLTPDSLREQWTAQGFLIPRQLRAFREANLPIQRRRSWSKSHPPPWRIRIARAAQMLRRSSRQR